MFIVSTQLRFNEKKATQVAAQLLRLRGGRMSYLKLIKLMYLADREALLRWGRPISTDRYVSMDKGPVLSRVLDLATEGGDPARPSIWAQQIGEPSHYEVALKGSAETDELSEAEVALLEEIFLKYGTKNRWELVDLTHQLPEWQDPQGSAIPITYGDILKAAGKTDLEAAAIENEIEALNYADTLLVA
jgi:uncharacterized phage-associated protein